MGSNRTRKVIHNNDAAVLRELRLKHGLSMRQAGKRLGYSSSYISQIENGRENPPRGEKLRKFLDLYGEISEKYFRELCRDWESQETDTDVVKRLIEKLPDEKIKFVRSMVEQLLKE